MTTIRTWFEGRTQREQRMVLAMALIALPLLIYLLLVVPLERAYKAALQDELAAVDRNGRVKAMADRMAAGSKAAPAVADLSLFLIDNARGGGLTVSAERGAEPALSTVRIDPTSAPAIFGWIRGLENQGYRIDSMRITPGTGGQVGAELVVRGGA